MFDHLFENRNTTVTNLLKLGDCLGRSLRENLEIFSIDNENKKVAFLSESGKVLSGHYSFGPDILLEKIRVQNSEIFSDNKTFDSFVNEKVAYFVGNINSNSYAEADTSFTDVLSLWENRLKFENVKKNLSEKATVFCEDQTILATEEFQRLLEMSPQFLDFLNEHKKSVLQVEEIENAIKLSNSVSKAFDFPRLSYSSLEESTSYKISQGVDKSVYELICKQELVKKELLESKRSFEDVWATNANIRHLASLIFSDSDEKILESLVEAVVAIPYLALTTKKQLFESISNAFSIGDNTAISTKELKTFVSKLFEMKKPLKTVVIDLLNEKYGINVQNLKETATFRGLANTQVVIFEALTRLAPKGSVIKTSLGDVAKLLRGKNGVEVIDVNEFLQECFEACEYDSFCNDFILAEELSFDTILTDAVNIKELIEATKEKLLLDKKKKKKKKKKGEEDEEDMAAANQDQMSPEDEAHKKETEKAEKSIPGSHGEDEDDSVRTAEKKSKVAAAQEAVETPEAPEADPDEPSAEEEEDETPLSKEAFLDTLHDMEDLLKGMSKNGDDEEEDEDEEASGDETPEEVAEE